jgi:hypothetical protein
VADPDLDALAATCEAATPGPWWAGYWNDKYGACVTAAPEPEPDDDDRDGGAAARWADWWEAATSVVDAMCLDARYIATFDPPTVEWLIAKARRAEALEELVRLLDKTGGKCWADSGDDYQCQLDPLHTGLHSEHGGLVSWLAEDWNARPSPWTPDALALLAAVTSDGEAG